VTAPRDERRAGGHQVGAKVVLGAELRHRHLRRLVARVQRPVPRLPDTFVGRPSQSLWPPAAAGRLPPLRTKTARRMEKRANMKKIEKKLVLGKQTLRRLDVELRLVRGAGGDENGDTVIDTGEAIKTIVNKSAFCDRSVWCL
jgi:hypothetical protein